MNLESGSMLGPYEILSLRGAGGMGEVYRARDTRLDRIVAVKVLPPGLSDSEQLRARFEREARTISSLSHPNICALFDVGSIDGTAYIVMEYLEGETLAERLAKGPLPTSLVVRYGAQIAEGLQHAHRAGITHRDLKPGNVMLTESGAKILDFGLAKYGQPSHRVFSDESAPVTLQSPITAEGTIVGTMQYMSPEQIEGRELDHRSDIFSLGVMLYEMATGQRPFRGESSAGLIASILTSDPIPIHSLRPDVAPALERIILTAIEKSPNERWQTAQDVGRQLRWISESSHTAVHATRARRPGAPAWAIAVASAAIAGSLTWLVMRNAGSSTATHPRLNVQVIPPADLQLRRYPELSSFAVSPDGRSIAFVARGVEGTAIHLRRLDSPDVTKIEHTDGALSPFWSSDSEWIGFTAKGKLWKVKASGGIAPEPIAEVTRFGARASWVGDTILFADTRGERREIYRVAGSGGKAAPVTKLKDDEFRHTWPLLLEDGRSFVYHAHGTDTMDRAIVLGRLDSEETTVLARNVSAVRRLGTDRLAWVRDGTLLAQRVDIEAGLTLGEPDTLAIDVSYFYPTARADFDASPAGVIVYRTDTSSGRLYTTDRAGTVTRVLSDQDLYWDHAIAHDGRKAAVTVITRETGMMDIWIYDLARGVRDRFTADPAIEMSPAWAPDGRSIVYSQGQGGTFPHLVRRPLSGSTSEDITPRGPFQYDAAFTPDGRAVYYQEDAGNGYDIKRLSIDDGTLTPVIATNFEENAPAISADGAWLAYTSNATGAYEIYVMKLNEVDPVPIRVSTRGGSNPVWRADGRELFFIDGTTSVTSATPGPSGRWDDARIQPLFRVERFLRGFDASPDGQSFLVSDLTVGPQDDVFHVLSGF